MRKKCYDKNGKAYYVTHVSSGFLDNISKWLFNHIGGHVYAVSFDSDCALIQWPITPFIPARKFKKLKAEARTLYPNEELYIALDNVLKSHGLIIR